MKVLVYILAGVVAIAALGGLFWGMAWVLQTVLAAFGLKVNLWICVLIWLMIGWIGNCFRAKTVEG